MGRPIMMIAIWKAKNSRSERIEPEAVKLRSMAISAQVTAFKLMAVVR